MELTLVNDNGDTQREQALGSELLWETSLLERSPGEICQPLESALTSFLFPEVQRWAVPSSSPLPFSHVLTQESDLETLGKLGLIVRLVALFPPRSDSRCFTMCILQLLPLGQSR